MKAALPIGAIAALLLGLPAWADTVTLKDGRKLVGKVVTEGEEEIILVHRFGEIPIRRSEIASWEKGPTPEEVYRDRAAALADDDLEGRLRLARWCLENDLDREARWEFQRVVEIDPEHREAREALGFVLHEGKWIPEAEHREITRYPWVRETRERLEATKVTLDFTRSELLKIVLALARQTEETFRMVSVPRLEKFRMTYKCEDRPAASVLEDLARNVPNLDYVFAEDAVVITSPKEARKIRRRYGMPARLRGMTAKEVGAALASRHLTLLFSKRSMPWVLRYLETLSGISIVLAAPAPDEAFSYQCTAKPLGEILNDILTPRGLRYEIVGASVLIR